MTRTTPDNWLSLAQNDLAAAQTLLEARQHLSLQAGLLCHQAMARILTAACIKYHVPAPADTDNLLRMVTELPWQVEMDDRAFQTLEWLNAYPILESMGVQNAGDLAALLTEEKTKELLDRTKELFDWIKAKL